MTNRVRLDGRELAKSQGAEVTGKLGHERKTRAIARAEEPNETGVLAPCMQRIAWIIDARNWLPIMRGFHSTQHTTKRGL